MKNIIRDLIHFFIIKTGRLCNNRRNYNKKLLIVRTDSLGDLILFSPSLKLLNIYYKGYKIDMLVKDYLKLAVEQSPYINEIITFNYNKFRLNLLYRFLIFFQIYKKNYEICINPAYSRDWFSDEISVWTDAKLRIGWGHDQDKNEKNYLNVNNLIYNKLIKSKFNVRTHEIERNKFFLQQIGIAVNVYIPTTWINPRTDFIKKLWNDNGLDKKIIIALFPGKMTFYQGWESNKFINLINFLNKRIENLLFLISGTSKDISTIQYDKNKNPSILNICGKTNVLELYDLINRVDLVIGYDSGPIHLAIAAGTKSLCILGGGHFGRFLPYGDPTKHKFIYKTMPCYDCNWNCIYKTTKCIDEISEETAGNIILKDLLKQNIK